MTREPPRKAPREPDPSDPVWVDHILDQLTSRPMPAGPDVASAPDAEPEPVDAAPEPPGDDVVHHDPPPAEEATPPPPRPAPPPARPVVPDATPPEPEVGLLDELLSLDLDPAGGPAEDPEEPPESPPVDPIEGLLDAPEAQPAPPERPEAPAPPPPPAASRSAAPMPRSPQPSVAGPPLVPPPPPVTEPPPVPPPIPPPPRRRASRGAAGSGTRPTDPLLAGAPSSPAQAPPRPRRSRAIERPEEPPEIPYDDYPLEFDEDLAESHSRWRIALGWALTVAIAIVLSLVIRSFVAHAFHVESSSMEPTLAPGDRILVNKLADNPSRGDLVVFSRPDGDLVKRVVALEGETVYFFDDGVVGIDDRYLQEPYLSAGTGTFGSAAIPNCAPSESVAGAAACTVPEDHVFVLGDNRGVSFDSRNFGPVPREDLIGNAALQFWPLGDLRRF